MDIIKFGIEKILYPLMEKRKGNRIRSNTALLLAGDTEPAEDKLRALLYHCVEHVPAYKKYAYLKDEIKADPYSAMRRCPCLTKADYRACPQSFIADNAEKNSLIANSSGGSTGTPVQFYMDRKTVEWYEASRWRGLAAYGITNGSRCLMIWGNPFELSKNEDRRFRMTERYMKNRRIIPAYELKAEKLDEYMAFIKHYRPEYIYGYAGALGVFSRLMIERGLTCPIPLKAVVSTSETLDEDIRAAIMQAFPQIPVVNEYGARDGGIIAYECPQGGLHLSSENLVAEIIDPQIYQPLKTGQRGLLAVTDLNNYVQPRLRYLLGDEAALAQEPCSCGDSRPCLKAIYGREDDIFRGTDGRYVHGVAFANRIKTLPQVEEFRIIQTAPETALVLLRTSTGELPQGIEELKADYAALLPGTEFSFELTDEIPPLPSGKKRYTIRKF